jgi:hypothetical protein
MATTKLHPLGLDDVGSSAHPMQMVWRSRPGTGDNRQLREAIAELAVGRTEQGFTSLDGYGAVLEEEDKEKRLATIAEKHLDGAGVQTGRRRGRARPRSAAYHNKLAQGLADLVRANGEEITSVPRNGSGESNLS